MCVLAGIPLVSTTWIAACLNQKQVAMPLDSMWVRSLPVKSEIGKRNSSADFGVAKMAFSRRGKHLLEKYVVQLFGSFDSPAKTDVLLLLKEAGATVSSQTATALACMQDFGASNGCLILLCDDSCTSISDVLYRQTKAELQKQRDGATTKGRVLVVNPQWLFDSIVCGSALPSESYAPANQNGQPYELWRLLHHQ